MTSHVRISSERRLAGGADDALDEYGGEQQQNIQLGFFIGERTRDISGRAQTNLVCEVTFHLQVTDNGKPGIIRLGQDGVIVYTAESDPDRTLGGPGPGGGNIQLHKENKLNAAPANPSGCEI